jgi:hypothetical protein
MPRNLQFNVGAAIRTAKRQFGHYVTIGNNNARRGNYYKTTSGGGQNFLTLPGVRGVQIRYPWVDLEPTAGTYTFGTVKTTYPDSERTIRADLWRCQQEGSRLIILLEDRTFDGSNPMPADMATNPQYVQYVTTAGGTGEGYTAVRWNATVRSRFNALVTALGNAFDSHANWYAIAFQETATGMNATQRDDTGYNALPEGQVYRDAIIAMLKNASNKFPTSQIFWYQNFFPIPAHDYRLQEVADSIKEHNGGNHGIVMGGPDILPDNSTLVSRCYPRYGMPPTGSATELHLFCAMQFDSYAHTHQTASPDPRMPGDTWTLGSLWTMDQLFRWGRDNLNLKYVMWENDTQGAQTFIPHGRDVIAANPTFNSSIGP